jgi:PAS domain S-box-containing protein
MTDLLTARTAAPSAVNGRRGPDAADVAALIIAPSTIQAPTIQAPTIQAPTIQAPAIQAAHAINQRIFETSLDLILVVDRRGTFIRVSPSSHAILGYHPDEMVSHNAATFLYHADLESTRNEMRQARHGRVMRHFECRYVHKHGRIVTLTWTGVWSEPEQQHFFIGRDITDLKETERRLRRSERRFEDVIEVSADWIWETDRQHRFIVFRGGTTHAAPLVRETMLNRTRWESAEADPDEDERWACHKADLDAHRPFRHFRYAIPTGAGNPLFLSSSGKPMFDDAGEFIGYLGTATDETVAVMAQRRAEQAEALLWNAIESIAEGFAIYDAEDVLVMCNSAYGSLFPDGAERVYPGVRFEELLRIGLARGYYPDAVGREEAWLAAQIREHRNPQAAREHRLHDGRWVMVTKRPMSNGWIASLRVEITALKAAQAAVRESEERLQRAQHLAHMGSEIRDLQTDQAEWSDETYRIFGVSRDRFVPSTANVLRMVHPDDRPKVQEAQDRIRQGGRPDAFECRIVRPDGAVRTIYRENEVISGAPGSRRQVAGTIHDITERRRTEEQLRQAQKMEAIGNLTGGVAHDFNNMLGVIVGNLEFAMERIAPDGELSQVIAEALDATLRGADLTRRLLAFARQQPLRPVRVDINGLIADTVRLLRRLLGEDIEVVLKPADDLWPVTVDPAQLEASLTNLATNARDAMPKGGGLSIKTANTSLDQDYAATHAGVIPGDFVVIEVSDTGIGMPADVMSQIFEPFFTTKEQGKGTGLGLSMVFGFLRQSGGHVNVYSEEGVGTTFRLYLPRPAVAVASETSGKRRSGMRGAGECILVVEDNSPLRRVILRQLRDLGYHVFEADRAATALDLLEHERVDLLFTDVVMPGGLDGLELASLAMERLPALKVLLTSGFPELRSGTKQEFGTGFRLLSKPYNKDDLADALHEAFHQ